MTLHKTVKHFRGKKLDPRLPVTQLLQRHHCPHGRPARSSRPERGPSAEPRVSASAEEHRRRGRGHDDAD